jgi:phage terminase large subunit
MIYSVDWGFTNPMVCVIIGFDTDGRKYIVKEFYKSQEKVINLIRWVKDQNIIWSNALERGYGDPAEPQFIHDFNAEGMNMGYANNEVLPGINKVFDALEPKGDGLPSLFVCEDCENVVEEFSVYRFKDAKDGAPLQENPLKVNDHSMDAVRYAVHTHNFGNDGFVLLDDPEGLVF